MGASELLLGDLRLAGNPALGRLERITHVPTGFSVSMDGNEPCWSVDVRSCGHSWTFGPEDCRIAAAGSGAVFEHPGSGAVVSLEWRRCTDGVAAAILGVRAGPGGSVAGVIFRLPGRVAVAGPGELDVLYYPLCAGMRIPDPASELFRPREANSADWMDRRLTVWSRGFDLPEREGERRLSNDYSGRCSMAWMHYAGPRGGLYLASHDAGAEHGLLSVLARRGERGLGLSIEKRFNRPLTEASMEFAVGLPGSDWRRSAELYRRWFESAYPPVRESPPALRLGPGLVCHYDFKWQNGEVGHRFSDIPSLMNEALSNGFDSLLCAGWNVGGFDNGYPQFRPDPDLGTAMELRDALRRARAMGGRVFLYVNAFSFDTDHPSYGSLGRRCAVEIAPGEPFVARWGTRELAGMCNSVRDWRRVVHDNVLYAVCELEASGVYLDQLAVRPRHCVNKEHAHEESWIRNNLSLLDEIRSSLSAAGRSDAILFSEFITDALATRLDFQLCHTCWMNGRSYAFPEMFRYTFPRALLADQVFQKPWGGDPPRIEESHVRDVIGQAFVNGLQLWTYDHALSNPRMGDFFRRATRLRALGAEFFARGDVADEPALAAALVPGVTAKAYRLEDGSEMVAVENRTGAPAELRLARPIGSDAVVRDVHEGRPVHLPAPVEVIPVSGARLSLCLPADRNSPVDPRVHRVGFYPIEQGAQTRVPSRSQGRMGMREET